MEIVFIISILSIMGIVFLYWQNKGLRLNKIEYTNSKIKKGLDGFKILHISDFHNDKILLNDVVRLAEKQSPDIVLITGDIIDSRKTDKNTALKLLCELNKISKVYYVTGNHENRLLGLGIFKEEIIKTGTFLLDDRKIVMKVNDEIFSIIGVSDPDFQTKERKEKEEKYLKTVNKLSLGDGTFKILLAHHPEYFKNYANANYDLIFSGHAHGGQFSIPFTDIGVFVPDQGLFPKYAAGIKKEKESTIIINRGIGNSLFPFRLFNRPEIILIALKSLDA